MDAIAAAEHGAALRRPETTTNEAALAQGDWEPAARALDVTGTDWARRSALVGIIAQMGELHDVPVNRCAAPVQPGSFSTPGR
ncbi:hypothetical protein ACH4PU_32595 [Streptomyces sp. NPDC021100]|uniref:hypothetical protein n=1 Tax=Streptomyces sp. NPDC021100 TaxID=3365114 RepID=UPI0037A979B4